MNFSKFYAEQFDIVYITEDVKDNKYINFMKNLIPDIPKRIIPDKSSIPKEHLNSKTLFVSSPRGKTVNRCPGSRGHICCNYLTIDLYVGCTIGCTYCIMQSYLNFSPIIVYADIEPVINRVLEIARRNKKKQIRIGTGEVGDSLLYDPLFNISGDLIESFSEEKNIYFELKTKTNFINHLLDIEKKGNAVIGFSLNPPNIILSEEGNAAKLEERLEAAKLVVESGYFVSFHFDPIFYYKTWETDYKRIIDSIYHLYKIPENKIAWISMGTFRYPPDLKDKIPFRDFFLEEFILARDKKYRYIQKIRSSVYKSIKKHIKSYYPNAPIYMCMESDAVWYNVFNTLPTEIPEIHDIFIHAEGV